MSKFGKLLISTATLLAIGLLLVGNRGDAGGAKDKKTNVDATKKDPPRDKDKKDAGKDTKDGPAKDKKETPTDVITQTKIADAQIAIVKVDRAFKAALEFLEEQGEVANLSKGQVFRSRNCPECTEYSFDVTMRVTGEAGEFAKLVYSTKTGLPAFVYFDNPRPISAKAVAPQPSDAVRAAFCFGGAWGPWQILTSECRNNIWCPFHKQKALYLNEKRSKTCPNGTVKTQNRWKKAHCGC